MNLFASAPDPPSELEVVGEHVTDPSQLLLRGVDGRHYAYSPAEGQPRPVEPDEGWKIEMPRDEGGLHD